MARLIYTRRALEDLERLTDFLLKTEPALAPVTINLIAEALQTLENHPLIGCPAEQDMRELVISRGRTGYLALSAYDEVRDVAVVLAIRHQPEAGYTSS